MSKSTTVKINNVEWEEIFEREEEACSGCGEATRGRIDGKPYCIDCAMKLILGPMVGLFKRGRE
jgi:hypothetical protein